MRTAQVEYGSGREMLEAYWGFLASGGLVIADRAFNDRAGRAAATTGPGRDGDDDGGGATYQRMRDEDATLAAARSRASRSSSRCAS